MTAQQSSALLNTPLTRWHLEHGAKMAPFAGWDMPIQYSGIIAEHQHTRTKAAVFDICHMGEFLIHGQDAGTALAAAISHNLSTLAIGRCRYGFILHENGGIIDDCIVYHMDTDRFMLVVNGACVEKDKAALLGRLPQTITFEDISPATGKIDLQGPHACAVLEDVLDMGFRDLPYFAFRPVTRDGIELLVSRTGYTGELGYELYLPWDSTLQVWELLLGHADVRPAGLGARDTLRLEAGLPLYGQDLDEAHTPYEAGYAAMLTSPASHVGKNAARRCNHALIGLSFTGRRAARHHDALHLPSGERVGVITSGSFGPTLGHAVALAWVDAAHADAPSFVVRAAKTELVANRATLPFYTGTAREKLV